ncbi:MAG TPA: MmcQ/YjbR family DNA-binding protein [Puia sp.]|nr:MmcQ/YjbR family DNA-binding protein [Puia sp.]
MNIEELREYCLSKKGTSEGFPFGENTLVFKVKEKIYLIASLNRLFLQFNVKCNPEKAVELREQYLAIQPGYHMNKKHWNTIIVDGTLSKKLIKEMIDISYLLIVQAIPNKEKRGLI